MAHIAFDRIKWQDTLIFNAARSAAASLIWGIGVALGNQNLTLALPLIVGFFIVLFCTYVPLGIALVYISRFFWPAGVVVCIIALLIAVGDPLVFIFSRMKPGILPIIDRFYPVNFAVVMFILEG